MIQKLRLLFFVLVLSSISGFSQNTLIEKFTFDEVERDYRLFVPSGYTEGASLPLVFNLHGFTSSSLEQEFYSAMNQVADTAGFFVCYADGIARSWNVGWNFGSTADDVGFISALIDHFIETYNIDPTRVYSCGMSNGGFMSYRLACELNDRIAAVASVTGSMSPNFFPTCQPGKAVPVLEIHGTADPTVAYNGTPNVSVPIEDVIAFWVNNNQCDLTADTIEIPNTSLLDLSTADRIQFDNCSDNTKVHLIKIQNGGHTWPGAFLDIGVTNQDFKASVEIWEFFKQFQLPITSTNSEEESFSTDLKVFPNPTTGLIQIDNIPPPFNCTIHDATGRLIRQFEEYPSRNIDVTEWKKGVYFITLEKDTKQFIRKIIKH